VTGARLQELRWIRLVSPPGSGAVDAMATEKSVVSVVATRTARTPESVIWLHFQECTGCSESLLRAEHPTLEKLILDVISLDYHETLMAAAGHQAEAARKAAMKANKGKYVLVVEGRDPDQGQRHLLQDRRPDRDRPAQGMRRRCRRGDRHRLLCASWGGMPSTARTAPTARRFRVSPRSSASRW
jgi:hydrogenase small subunit